MHIEVRNISKSFGNHKAVSDVSFSINRGKLIGLLGPSGGGKSTILRILAGLESPDTGDILINGKRVNDVAPQHRGIGFVFQNYALFKHMNVFDNIAFGLTIRKTAKAEIKGRVNELLDLTGLRGFEHRYPHQLSGGQRQRVAFARALAPKPDLLLLDEPFAAIDAKVRKELRTWLKQLINTIGITSIFVTHDQDEAVEVADEMLIVQQGHLEQQGSPVSIYTDPQTAFVAGFIGHSSLVEQPNRLRGFERAQVINGARAPSDQSSLRLDGSRNFSLRLPRKAMCVMYSSGALTWSLTFRLAITGFRHIARLIKSRCSQAMKCLS